MKIEYRFKFHPLGHGAGNYGCRCRGKGKMEEIIGEDFSHLVVICVCQEFTKPIESSRSLITTKA